MGHKECGGEFAVIRNDFPAIVSGQIHLSDLVRCRSCGECYVIGVASAPLPASLDREIPGFGWVDPARAVTP